MEKKFSYSKPFMVMERFTMEVFCSGCSLVIDSIPTQSVQGLLRIDWNGDGHFNYSNELYGESHMGSQGAELSKFEIINCNVYKLVEPENGNLGTNEDGFDYINGGTYRDGIFGIKDYKYELYATKLARNTYSQNGSYYVIFENDLGQASVHKNNS